MYNNGYDGYGVPQDDTQAAKWYRLAAEQGHAAAQGDKRAITVRDFTAKEMTLSQIAEGQKLSRELFK